MYFQWFIFWILKIFVAYKPSISWISPSTLVAINLLFDNQLVISQPLWVNALGSKWRVVYIICSIQVLYQISGLFLRNHFQGFGTFSRCYWVRWRIWSISYGCSIDEFNYGKRKDQTYFERRQENVNDSRIELKLFRNSMADDGHQ